MPTIDLMGGKLQIYQRGNSRFWQARTSVGGRQLQHSTKREILGAGEQGRRRLVSHPSSQVPRRRPRDRRPDLQEGRRPVSERIRGHHGGRTQRKVDREPRHSLAPPPRPLLRRSPHPQGHSRQSAGIPGSPDDLLQRAQSGLQEQAQAQDTSRQPAAPYTTRS